MIEGTSFRDQSEHNGKAEKNDGRGENIKPREACGKRDKIANDLKEPVKVDPFMG